jgi:hypothetical protein
VKKKDLTVKAAFSEMSQPTANSQQKTTKKLDSAIIKPWNVRLISLSPFFRFHRNPPAP